MNEISASIKTWAIIFALVFTFLYVAGSVDEIGLTFAEMGVWFFIFVFGVGVPLQTLGWTATIVGIRTLYRRLRGTISFERCDSILIYLCLPSVLIAPWLSYWGYKDEKPEWITIVGISLIIPVRIFNIMLLYYGYRMWRGKWLGAGL